MSVVFEILRNGAPLLTVLAIFAALRGQRVTNANAAREKLEQARNEARMVILSPTYPTIQQFGQERTDAGVTSLVLEVAGPSPIVQVESVLVEPSGPLTESFRLATLKTVPVLKPESEHTMGTVRSSVRDEPVSWRVIWADRYGYSWCARFSFEDGAKPVELLRAPNGQGPITTPSGWQKFRNALVPYDNWAPRRRPLK